MAKGHEIPGNGIVNNGDALAAPKLPRLRRGVDPREAIAAIRAATPPTTLLERIEAQKAAAFLAGSSSHSEARPPEESLFVPSAGDPLASSVPENGASQVRTRQPVPPPWLTNHIQNGQNDETEQKLPPWLTKKNSAAQNGTTTTAQGEANGTVNGLSTGVLPESSPAPLPANPAQPKQPPVWLKRPEERNGSASPQGGGTLPAPQAGENLAKKSQELVALSISEPQEAQHDTRRQETIEGVKLTLADMEVAVLDSIAENIAASGITKKAKQVDRQAKCVLKKLKAQDRIASFFGRIDPQAALDMQAMQDRPEAFFEHLEYKAARAQAQAKSDAQSLPEKEAKRALRQAEALRRDVAFAKRNNLTAEESQVITDLPSESFRLMDDFLRANTFRTKDGVRGRQVTLPKPSSDSPGESGKAYHVRKTMPVEGMLDYLSNRVRRLGEQIEQDGSAATPELVAEREELMKRREMLRSAQRPFWETGDRFKNRELSDLIEQDEARSLQHRPASLVRTYDGDILELARERLHETQELVLPRAKRAPKSRQGDKSLDQIAGDIDLARGHLLHALGQPARSVQTILQNRPSILPQIEEVEANGVALDEEAESDTAVEPIDSEEWDEASMQAVGEAHRRPGSSVIGVGRAIYAGVRKGASPELDADRLRDWLRHRKRNHVGDIELGDPDMGMDFDEPVFEPTKAPPKLDRPYALAPGPIPIPIGPGEPAKGRIIPIPLIPPPSGDIIALGPPLVPSDAPLPVILAMKEKRKWPRKLLIIPPVILLALGVRELAKDGNNSRTGSPTATVTEGSGRIVTPRPSSAAGGVGGTPEGSPRPASPVAVASPEKTATRAIVVEASAKATEARAPTRTATAKPTSTETTVPIVEIVSTPEPTSTETATVTNTPEPTVTETPTSTPTNTATVTSTLEPTETSTATQEPTVTATNTLEPTSTNTATVTVTNTPTASPTHTVEPSATSTDTPEPTVTLTSTTEPTSTNRATVTMTPQPTETATVAPTSTPTETPTVTATNTSEPTSTPAATVILTPTTRPTLTPTQVPETPIATASPTATELPPSPTASATASPTATATLEATATVEPGIDVDTEAKELAKHMTLITISGRGDSISARMEKDGIIGGESQMTMEEFKKAYNDPELVGAWMLLNLDQLNKDWRRDGLQTRTAGDIVQLVKDVKAGRKTMQELWGEQKQYDSAGNEISAGEPGMDRVLDGTTYMTFLTDEEWAEAVRMVFQAQKEGKLDELQDELWDYLREKKRKAAYGEGTVWTLMTDQEIVQSRRKIGSDDEETVIFQAIKHLVKPERFLVQQRVMRTYSRFNPSTRGAGGFRAKSGRR